MDKTHAMRVLDAKKILYTPRVYDASGDFHPGAEAAALIGADPDTVYKTLVVLRDDGAREGAGGKPMLVMIPVEAELDLKRLAAAIGARKLRMAKQREAEDLTGMQAGGISALGLKQPSRFDVLLDQSARTLEKIHISAGVRGVDLEVGLEDLVTAAAANFIGAT